MFELGFDVRVAERVSALELVFECNIELGALVGHTAGLPPRGCWGRRFVLLLHAHPIGGFAVRLAILFFSDDVKPESGLFAPRQARPVRCALASSGLWPYRSATFYCI